MKILAILCMFIAVVVTMIDFKQYVDKGNNYRWIIDILFIACATLLATVL